MKVSVISFGRTGNHEEKVLEWIDDNFVLQEIENYPFFPYSKLIRDKNKETMIVFWCLIYGRVDYRFQDA